MVYIFLLFSGWSYERIGSGNNSFQGVRAGCGRNDGIIRIYGGCDDNHAYEYTFQGTTWVRVDMGAASGRMHGIFIGPGRNDDTLRVYGSTWTQEELWEFTYRDGHWNKVIIGNPGNYSYEPPVAPARNDDTMRVYTGLNGGAVYEFTYRNGHWDKEYVGGASGTDNSVHDIWIDYGRNDDTLRIYAVNTDGKLWEFTYTDQGWVSNIVAIHETISWGVIVGKGRNDDTNRIYVCTGADTQHGGSEEGKIFEYTWNGEEWDSVFVGKVPKHLYGLAMGQARNDSINRIYAGCADGYVYEFTYTDSGWVKEKVGGPGNTWFHDAVVANGRNDDTLRLYVAAGDRYIYEFTYRPDSKVLVEPDQEDSTYGGVPLRFSFYVHNMGVVDEPINLQCRESERWNLKILDSLGVELEDTDNDGKPDPGTLLHGDSVKVIIEVVPPSSVMAGDKDTLILYGYSHYYPAIYDSAVAVVVIKEQSSLELYPDQADSVLPGSYIDYTVWVKNQGNHSETVNLWSSGLWEGWGLTFLDSKGDSLMDSDGDNKPDIEDLQPYGDSVNFTVRILSDDSAIAFTEDTVVVVGEGRDVSDGVHLITHVLPLPKPDIEENQMDSAYAGESIEYPLTITNVGNATEYIEIEISQKHSWSFSLVDTAGNPLMDNDNDSRIDTDTLRFFGGSIPFKIVLDIPRATPHLTIDTTVVYAISSIDNAIKDSVSLITTVLNPFDTIYSVKVFPDTTGYVEEGDTAIYPVQIVNTGNIPVDFDLNTGSSRDWIWFIEDKNGNRDIKITPVLNPGDTFSLWLYVIPPESLGVLVGEVDTVNVIEHSIVAKKYSVSDTAHITTIFIPRLDIHNFPNPFGGNTTFIFNIPEDGDARLEIYTRNGEHVKTIFDKPFKRGIGYKAPWNGKNEYGIPVSPGVYIYILRFSGASGVRYVKKKAMKER